jgi:hypothetical protein
LRLFQNQPECSSRFETGFGKASVYVERDIRAQAPVYTIGLYKERFIRLLLEEERVRRNGLFAQSKEDMMKNIAQIRASPGGPRRWKCFNKRLAFMML